jgi:hypothetical protein
LPAIAGLTFSRRAILSERERRYRRRIELRVTTPQQAVRFVRDVGFCFLFPSPGIELPSLWDAVAGRVVKPTSSHSGYEIERTWGWKDALLGKKKWYYGKLIRGKATLVSLDFLPNFYALSSNYGDYEHDYLEEYREGRLSAEAKTLYELLLRHNAMDTVRLRREAHLSAQSSKSRFDKALLELQLGLKVMPIGIAAAGAWRYAFIYEIVARWLPSVAEQARRLGRSEAQQAILDRYLSNVIASTPQEAARIFRWQPAETRQTAGALAEAGRARLDVKIAGIREPQMLTASIRAAHQ